MLKRELPMRFEQNFYSDKFSLLESLRVLKNVLCKFVRKIKVARRHFRKKKTNFSMICEKYNLLAALFKFVLRSNILSVQHG